MTEKSAHFFEEIHEERHRRRKFVYWGLGALVFILLLWALIWFFLYSSMFKVKNITVKRGEHVSEDAALALLQSQVGVSGFWQKILGTGNILAWPREVKTDIKLLPALQKIEISKNYDNKEILAVVKERTPAGIWCFANSNPKECFWFDEEGVLFKKSFITEGNLLNSVDDYSRGSLQIGETVLPQEFMKNLLSIFRTLDFAGLSVREVRLNNIDLEELEVLTRDGPKFRFSLRFPAEGAIEVIQSLRKTRGLQSLEYIDFTVEHRAYYK